MSKQFDLLIVGAGLFGATCAYELTRKGFRCLVLDKRDHIAGNCFTEERDGINVHRYGPHIFHTANKAVWDWINQFTRFHDYRHSLKANCNGTIYSLPVSLFTLRQLWGVKTPEEAERRLAAVREKSADASSMEGWMLSQVGREVYEMFYAEYSRKQWGRPPAELPAAIAKRVPIRLTYDDSYFDDPYQGIPVGGYTAIFGRLLAGIEVRLNTDYFEDRARLDSLARRVLYTGPIDRFFDYRFGKLEYRSIRFDWERLERPDFQGISVMNYPLREAPFTRIIEHKHFEFGNQPVTWITREYPVPQGNGHEPMYPIRDAHNQRIYDDYQALAGLPEWRNFYFGGRLAEYKYYDMHQVIASALAKVKHIEAGLTTPSLSASDLILSATS